MARVRRYGRYGMIRLLILATVTGAVMTGASIPTPRTTGLQTNTAELATFIAGAGTTYLTEATALNSFAGSADITDYDIQSGPWEDSAGGNCVPDGETQLTNEFQLEEAARAVWTLALSGHITAEDLDYADARSLLLDITATTDFDFGTDLSGGNQCILDLAEAVFNLTSAAWLMEEDYGSWTTADRQALADWLVDYAIVGMSWAAESRKNNWGMVAAGSLLAATEYARTYRNTITLHDDSTFSPKDYIEELANVTVPTLLDTTTPLDSSCASNDPAYVYGVQSLGQAPDELRRGSVGIAACDDTTINAAASCGGAPDGCDVAQFYQHKFSNGLAKWSEAIRRIDGNGTRGYDLQVHGGSNQTLYDLIDFGTGGNDFDDSFEITNTVLSQKYAAGEYYQDCDLVEAAADGTTNGQIRGGTDWSFAAVTHAPGVAYATSACP